MISVYIADDHQLFIEGIISMLENHPEVKITGHAYNGEELIKLIDKKKPEVVLLDVNMPGMDGISTCKYLSEKHPDVRVLALSMYSEASIIANMIENGALGYILKNARKDELVHAIKEVAAGKTYYSSEASRNLIAHWMSHRGIEKPKPTEPIKPKLTRREKDVLYWIIQEYTSAEIAEKLFVSHATVETHRKNLLEKLGVRNSVGLVKSALDMDLLEGYEGGNDRSE